nr:Ig-like domain-containing protein [uncultured Bacteroides sp.]
MYVITGANETTGALEITSAYLGELKFATGGGTDVTGIPIEVIQLSEYDVTIERGATKLITASWQPTDATNTVLSWVSSNTLVASVNAGTITGNNKGTAVITVKARSGAKETVNVTVVVSLVSLEIEGSGKIVAGYDEELTLVPTPLDADLDITLSSSNSAVTIEKSIVTNKLIAKTSATSGSTIIKAVNINGKQATIDLTVVPYIVNVTSDNIDKTDSSVTSIFTNWTIERKGSVTSYKYTESYMKDGVKTTLQSVDYTAIPDNSIIQIELYAEFGNKIIDWTFKDAAGNEESIICNVLYKEPELVHYSFDVNVTCTPEEASAMTMEVPFYKYDKKFAYNLRNDDTRPSLWRMGFRYVNREWDAISIPWINGYSQSQIDAKPANEVRKAPRRLGYTDGTGIIKTFCFDTAGMVVEGSGTTEDPAVILWDRTDNTDRVNLVDSLKAKDYGGHFLVHNMAILATDSQYYTPKNPEDYTYALQRDRQVIYDKLGYTSVHFANPDGAWWYTRPVIKDPKTLLMSGGGKAFDVDPNDVYGKPAFRSHYNYNYDFSKVPLSEIRNTLLVEYIFNNNNPYSGNIWKTQYSKANMGLPTFAVELTHHIGFVDGYPESYEGNRNFFNEVYDVVGANGVDYIWFCSGDEVVEYMYYQRVANITKTITSTGCKFNLSFDIPDYLSYKTYSVKIKNLPSNAAVEMSTDKTLTYYSKNMSTGLINWGVSPDISERANRYLAAYKANTTNDNLDKAWYFVRQMGEMGTVLAAQLPAFNEKPVISSITYNATPTDSNIEIVTTNGNKEFGEADYLDISIDETFTSFTTYQIPSNGHKYYNSLDTTTCKDTFSININPNFGVANTYYARLRNFYGNSNTYAMGITLTRTTGVNDPAIEFILPDKFTSDAEVTFTITHSYVSAMRYKLTDTFTDWESPVESITIPMTKGTTYTLVVQGKNNLDEIVEHTYTINFTGKQQIILFGNVASAGNSTDVGYVNKVQRPYTDCPSIFDLEGNTFCKEQGHYGVYFATQLATLRTKWGLTGEVAMSEAYWSVPALITDSGNYPNDLIYDGTTRSVTLYGDIHTVTTEQTVKYLTGVPQGTYKVRLLLSTNNQGMAIADNPNILRVNNTTQKITDTRIFYNNNSVWQTFDNIIVGEDGYMLIGQYSDVPMQYSHYSLPPIVLIEITKLT